MGSRPKATCTAPSPPFPSFPQVTLQWLWGQGAWPNSGSVPKPTTGHKLHLFPAPNFPAATLFYQHRRKVELPVTMYRQKYLINDPAVYLGIKADDA